MTNNEQVLRTEVESSRRPTNTLSKIPNLILCARMFYLHVCMFTTHIFAAHRNQKAISDTLQLQSWEAVNHHARLGIKPRILYMNRKCSYLCQAISPAHQQKKLLTTEPLYQPWFSLMSWVLLYQSSIKEINPQPCLEANRCKTFFCCFYETISKLEFVIQSILNHMFLGQGLSSTKINPFLCCLLGTGVLS